MQSNIYNDMCLSQKQNVIIYVLELEHNKYYIGKKYNGFTNKLDGNINDILPELFTKSSYEWYTIYKPIKLIETITQLDIFDITQYVLKYMTKYGIDNVRGGCFTDIVLSYSDYTVLHKMIRELTEYCIYCNSSKHTYNDCPHISLIGKLKKATNNVKVDVDVDVNVEVNVEVDITENFTIVSKNEHGELIITQSDGSDGINP